MRAPAKAAYLALEHDAELEFEHYLATKLTMTVDELRRRMSNAEFVRWNIYYAREAQQLELEQAKQKG